MRSLLLLTFTSVCFLTARVSAVTTETVVGVAGRKVTLPCRSEAVDQGGVEVCWGRGEPSLFTCHNTLINADADQVTYRKSYRYSMSASSSLSIFNTRPADSGFYHCRVQLPGLFNDQTSTVHLIIISPRPVLSETSERSNVRDAGNLNTPQMTTEGFSGRAVTETTGSDVTGDDTTGPVVARVQSSVQQQQQQQVDSLQSFIGNTVRVSFIVFIPAVLLTAAYRVWRTSKRPETDRRLNQSEQEADSSV